MLTIHETITGLNAIVLHQWSAIPRVRYLQLEIVPHPNHDLSSNRKSSAGDSGLRGGGPKPLKWLVIPNIFYSHYRIYLVIQICVMFRYLSMNLLILFSFLFNQSWRPEVYIMRRGNARVNVIFVARQPAISKVNSSTDVYRPPAQQWPVAGDVCTHC